MRILWVKTGPLHPIDTGGKRRTHAMLTEISRQHEVTYLALQPEGVSISAEEATDPYAKHKVWIPTQLSRRFSLKFWWELLQSTLFSSLPHALQRFTEPAMHEELKKLSVTDSFDLVICDFLFPGCAFLDVKWDCPTVLFQHNIESQIWMRLAAAEKSSIKSRYLGLQHGRMLRWEEKLSRLFDGVITVSPDDARLARELYNLENVLGDVPTGVDTTFFQPVSGLPSGPFTLGFLGSMDWMPNIDACEYLLDDIMPLVHAIDPNVRVKIIGRNPPAHLRARACDLIEVTGTVDDVRSYVQSCHAIAVPLRAGGGTRIKIYEAMAMGVPVISTRIGAEGLPLTHGENIVLADDAPTFAEAILSLVSDPSLAQRLAHEARLNVVNHHSWAAATAIFMKHCESCPKPSAD